MNRFQVVVWHGEARTLFYVVASRAEDDWEVVRTFHTRAEAQNECDYLRQNRDTALDY